MNAICLTGVYPGTSLSWGEASRRYERLHTKAMPTTLTGGSLAGVPAKVLLRGSVNDCVVREDDVLLWTKLVVRGRWKCASACASTSHAHLWRVLSSARSLKVVRGGEGRWRECRLNVCRFRDPGHSLAACLI